MGVQSKDPAAVLDFEVDWSDWLEAGDAISISTWAVPTGLTKMTDNHSQGLARVWLSGGTAGRVYEVVNHVLTTGGLEDERTVYVVVEQQ